MDSDILTMSGIILVAGAVGGIVNALMTASGVVVPRFVAGAQGETLWVPGFLGNVITGAIAAVISWGLYGPFSAALVVHRVAAPPPDMPPGMTLAALVGAILTGVGGARWLSNEVDKKLLRAAAAEAAAKDADPGAAQRIALAPPLRALALAREMRGN